MAREGLFAEPDGAAALAGRRANGHRGQLLMRMRSALVRASGGLENLEARLEAYPGLTAVASPTCPRCSQRSAAGAGGRSVAGSEGALADKHVRRGQGLNQGAR